MNFHSNDKMIRCTVYYPEHVCELGFIQFYFPTFSLKNITQYLEQVEYVQTHITPSWNYIVHVKSFASKLWWDCRMILAWAEHAATQSNPTRHPGTDENKLKTRTLNWCHATKEGKHTTRTEPSILCLHRAKHEIVHTQKLNMDGMKYTCQSTIGKASTSNTW